MPSLKNEAKLLSREGHAWLRGEQARTSSKRKLPEETPPTNKRRTCTNCKKRRLLADENDDVELEELEELETKPIPNIFGAAGSSREGNEVEDADYLAFLQLLKGRMNSHSDLGNSAERNQHDPSKISRQIVPCSFKSLIKDGEDDVDPHYKLFLENVRQDGHSYVLEMEINNNRISVKYEEKNKSSVGVRRKASVRNASIGRRQKGNVTHRAKPKPKTKPAYAMEVGCSSRNPVCTPPHSFLSSCDPGTLAAVDECYLKFLERVWVNGDSLIYQSAGVTVKFEQDEGVVINPEMGRPHLTSFENEKNYSPCTILNKGKMAMNEDDDDDDSDCVEILDDTSVKVNNKEKLKEKLKEILQKAYDEKELNEKLTAAELRKPLERNRTIRGRDLSYATKRDGLSYLDFHPDLKAMVKNAIERDVPERALALLRCLFFYYENVGHQESFIPWINPPSWLHTIICDCSDTSKCPMKYGASHRKSHQI